jgi:hypothetical protein
MAVGVNGTLGKCMIRQGHGINVEVRRSLRDVFRKVPMLSMKVEVINMFPLLQFVIILSKALMAVVICSASSPLMHQGNIFLKLSTTIAIIAEVSYMFL